MPYKDLQKQRNYERLRQAKLREAKRIAEGRNTEKAQRSAQFESQHPDWRLDFVALNETEKTILVLFFGLDGNKPRSLRDIAGMLGCSHEQVRKIKDAALLKLGGGA